MSDDVQVPEEEQERSGGYIGKEASTDPVVRKTAKLVRRVGFTFMALLFVWTIGPIFVAVIGGLMKGTVYDPVSHRLVDQDTRANDCKVWGLDILSMKVGEEQKTQWLENCGEAHPLIADRLSRSPKP